MNQSRTRRPAYTGRPPTKTSSTGQPAQPTGAHTMPSVTRRILLVAAVVLSLLGVDVAAWASGTVTVINGTASSPWIKFDTDGNGLDAHDGEIKEYGGTYYLYGTSY